MRLDDKAKELMDLEHECAQRAQRKGKSVGDVHIAFDWSDVGFDGGADSGGDGGGD